MLGRFDRLVAVTSRRTDVTVAALPDDLDRAVGFTLPARSARGRAVRLGPAIDLILSAHAYPPAIEALLAEALTLTALIGSTLKEGQPPEAEDAGQSAQGQLTLQAQTSGGIVRLLVCDYRGGDLRGYVDFDDARLPEGAESASLFALFGTGNLTITFDRAGVGLHASGSERYQGIVPLDGDTLAEAVESYFVQSDQIPTMIRLAVAPRGAAGRTGEGVAGGILLQHLPAREQDHDRLHVRLDHPEWEHVAMLGATVAADELTDPRLALETLIWRLFNEENEIRQLSPTALRRGCRCTVDHFAQVLAGFPAAEQREMADDHGLITVDCAFCSAKFPVRAAAADPLRAIPPVVAESR